MRTLLSIICLFSLCSFSQGAFAPLSLEQKIRSSDVIVRAKVVKMSNVLIDKSDKNSWRSPSRVATLELLQTYHKAKNVKVLAKFKVYCGFRYNESPDLTDGREYFMFLKRVKGDIYKPVGIATMHPIYEKRVLNFGMDHPKDLFESFEERSTKLTDWVSRIAKIYKG